MIDVTHVAVGNFLYDREVYQSLLCTDSETAKKIAYGAPERNVKACVDPQGTRYIPFLRQMLTNNNLHGRPLLVADARQIIEDAVT